MVDWSRFMIQAFSSIIGSSLVVFGITTVYNDFYNKPHIRIDITSPHNVEKKMSQAIIKVANEGVKPAKNVELTINAPGNIRTPTFLSSENFTISNSSNSNVLKIHIPRLVQGNGSIVKLNINVCGGGVNYTGSIIKSINGQMINCKEDFDTLVKSYVNKTIQMCRQDEGNSVPKCDKELILPGIEGNDVNFKENERTNYTVYVTHDDGSNFKIAYSQDTLVTRFFGDWYDPITVFAFLDTVLGISFIIFIIPYADHLHSKHRELHQANFIYKILKEIISIRKHLEIDPMTVYETPNEWNSKNYLQKHEFIENANDFILIDDFFTKLNARNLAIKSKKTNEIPIRNKECLRSAQHTLKSIDWKKYKALITTLYSIRCKSPVITSIIAAVGGFFFLSGIGHLYVQNVRRGAILLIISTFFRIFLLITIITMFNDDRIEYALIGNYDSSILGQSSAIQNAFTRLLYYDLLGPLSFVALLIYLLIGIWNVFDAKSSADKYNKEVQERKRHIENM
jgi:hypothetical protein